MRFFESPGSVERFRRTPWAFQQTFRTPLRDLPHFVDVILSALPKLESGIVVIDQAVMGQPQYDLPPFCVRHSIPANVYRRDTTFEAETPEEVRELLEAVLSEWIDFAFIPKPKPFAIYADHDEFTTFLGPRKASLNRVVQAMTVAGFDDVKYVPRFGKA